MMMSRRNVVYPLALLALVVALSLLVPGTEAKRPGKEEAAKEDFYTRLGVSRGASEAQIKKAYKKKARQWHPDHNKHREKYATKKFREIAEAYEVLTDPNKKAIYDQYGEEGLKQDGSGGTGGGPGGGGPGAGRGGGGGFGGGFGGFGGFDFSDLFGGGGGKQQQQQRQNRRGPGGGSPGGGFGFGGGGSPGGDFGSAAPPPSGPKTKVDVFVTMEELLVATKKDVEVNGRTVTVQIPAGALPGKEITIPGQNAVAVVRDAPGQKYTREGEKGDIVYLANITLAQALSSSVTVEVPLLGGRVIKVPILGKVISPSSRKVLDDQGLPDPKRASRRGRLLVKFNITFPKKMSADQFKRIKAVLDEIAE